MTPELTDFQMGTERQLADRLKGRGIELSGRQVEGSTDPAIKGMVDGIRIWIYPEGACVIGRGTDRVFEKVDYSTLDELGSAFIEKVDEILNRSA